MTQPTDHDDEAVDTVGPLLLDSVRSTGTSRSAGSDTSSQRRRRIDKLSRGTLMRAQSDRDPLAIYEIMEMLGEGSMGSVSRVRKRVEAVGGSARAAFVQKHHTPSAAAKCCCFGWLRFLQLPSQGDVMVVSDNGSEGSSTTATAAAKKTRSSRSVGSSSTTASSTTNRKMYRQSSSIVKFDTHKDTFYALKSIHLDRCSTKEYVDELKVSAHAHTKWDGMTCT